VTRGRLATKQKSPERMRSGLFSYRDLWTPDVGAGRALLAVGGGVEEVACF
jgi:hypothetical protein